MNHEEAARLSLVEKYLLEELPPDLRDEFEEHYFDCQECADDVRATAAFLDTAKEELKRFPPENAAEPAKKPWLAWLWAPAVLVPALAACLLVIAYQGFVVYPHYKSEIAELQAPEILPSVSLAGGNSRGGGTIPSVVVRDAHAFLLVFDIPTQDRFSSYTCELYSPPGALAWSVQVSAEAARDTVTIRVPAAQVSAGTYTLAVRGNTGSTAGQGGTDLVRYRFKLSTEK